MKTINPFEHYSSKLISKLQLARKEREPILWLYESNLRTEAFMLQSLCRLSEKGLNNENFKRWNKLYKKLEDTLGQVDFYDVFYEEFKTNKKISQQVKDHIATKRDKAINKFEKLLDKKGGLENRTKVLSDSASKEIKFDKKTVKSIEAAIQSEINKIKEFVESTNCNFKHLEEEVHELRRKIRWISMYGHSLAGVIQLKESTKKERWEGKYLTKKIVGLAFNKLPANSFPASVVFSKKHFYALSWLINELGELKDNGLRLEFLSAVISKTENLNHEKSILKAQQALGSKTKESDVLKQASLICNDFFYKHQILDGLVIKQSV